jgi:dipeptidyl aminopeptidase/acylaminoacyl peptidase
MPRPPYGLWPSPIDPQSLAAAVRLGDVQCAGPYVVWHESRAGRGVLCCANLRTADAPLELTPPDLAVRARVGYGGGDFCAQGELVVFVEASSGRLYRQPIAGGPARPITPAFGAAAAPALSPDGRWVAYVHSDGEHDCVAIVDAAGRQWPQRLLNDRDFYMQPAWHPGGELLAAIAWDHPQMPWDGTELLLATLDCSGATPVVTTVARLAGDAGTAVLQPAFAPDGRSLAFVSDASGWGQVQLYDLERRTTRTLTSAPAEHGEPAWVQGVRVLAWSADSRRITVLRNSDGVRKLIAVSVDGGEQELSPALPYTWFNQIAAGADETLATVASAPDTPPQVIGIHAGQVRIFRRSAATPFGALAAPRPVHWAGPDGSLIHAILYPPPGPAPTDGSLPPAIIRVHGGPTGQATSEYSALAQYFATRGFAVLDLNFRGSTGYGREYLRALDGAWGQADLEDLLSAAEYLDATGEADPARLVVMGSSSGGYTVLQALCHAPGRFRAGICLYGVSDLFRLAAETHKFEAHYTDTLIGPLPQAAALYRERSPAFHADRIRDPLAIFHGSDDTVVPPGQADAIVASLRRRGIPHHFTLFPGEGHGFRRPETLTALYRAIDDFLREYVLFA